jgi:antitoxin ParD1/3/4
MNVSLTPELEQLVDRKVQTGRYGSASDVIREALSLMQARDEMQALQMGDADAQIAAGMASLRAGRGVDGETYLAAMDTELVELERRNAS